LGGIIGFVVWEVGTAKLSDFCKSFGDFVKSVGFIGCLRKSGATGISVKKLFCVMSRSSLP
jgi:hypothetical protein